MAFQAEDALLLILLLRHPRLLVKCYGSGFWRDDTGGDETPSRTSKRGNLGLQVVDGLALGTQADGFAEATDYADPGRLRPCGPYFSFSSG